MFNDIYYFTGNTFDKWCKDRQPVLDFVKRSVDGNPHITKIYMDYTCDENNTFDYKMMYKITEFLIPLEFFKNYVIDKYLNKNDEYVSLCDKVKELGINGNDSENLSLLKIAKTKYSICATILFLIEPKNEKIIRNFCNNKANYHLLMCFNEKYLRPLDVLEDAVVHTEYEDVYSFIMKNKLCLDAFLDIKFEHLPIYNENKKFPRAKDDELTFDSLEKAYDHVSKNVIINDEEFKKTSDEKVKQHYIDIFTLKYLI